MKMLDKPCWRQTGAPRRIWRALLALAASALLLGGPALAAEPGHFIELLSGAGHADGSGWQSSVDGVNWIPAYAPYPNPLTMPNPRLNSLGVHGDLMWHWAGPGLPGSGSPPNAARFRYMLDIPPGGLSQLIALVAADDELTLTVNGQVIGHYLLTQHQQPNSQPIVVPMDLTPALHEGVNEIRIDAADVLGVNHWLFFDPYNINASPTEVLGAHFAGPDSLVGDRDDFHGGDAADAAPKSAHVQAILDVFANTVGQGAGVDLDVAADNMPVGMTHNFTLPPGAIITSAKVAARVQMTGDNVVNDIIYYNDSTAAVGISTNVVTLFDLLGGAPQFGRTYLLDLNLAKLPLRATNPGATVSGPPDSIVNLFAMLQAQQHLDLVFADDTMVDFSELTITYTMPGMPAGDLDGNGAVDSADVDIILTGLNTPALGPTDPRDLDHDGRITILDVRKLVAGCGKPRCAK